MLLMSPRRQPYISVTQLCGNAGGAHPVVHDDDAPAKFGISGSLDGPIIMVKAFPSESCTGCVESAKRRSSARARTAACASAAATAITPARPLLEAPLCEYFSRGEARV